MGNSQFTGLNLMGIRLNYQGGSDQQDRMIKDKRWTFDHTVLYSYQAAKIHHISSTQESTDVKALINPDKTKQDYDDKILSVGTEYNFKPGDIFEWSQTKTNWIIYLQDLTELSYFKGEIRRCNYEVSWLDENNVTQHTWLAVRGPVETAIDFIQKGGNSVDNPNYSLNILMPKTDATLKYFKRYAKFYLQGIESSDQNLCWRVEAMDSISMQGVLEINADEYYANDIEDDKEKGLIGGLILTESTVSDDSDSPIKGLRVIKPLTEYTYTYEGSGTGEWCFDHSLPLYATVDKRVIKLKWLAKYKGHFVLAYGDSECDIEVKSLF